VSGGTPATVTLTRAGIAFTLHAYDHDPRATPYGLEAADALGLDPDRVFKTLVVDSGATKPVLAVAVVPVSGQLDLGHCAAALGVKRVVMADKTLVQRTTGYVLGGVSPLGQRTVLPTVIDETAQLWETIYVSAGKRGLDLGIAPTDLAAVTNATFADIAR
jgi:Cys-tRNA(Pro)/Cys-tRNA(Cys) deacylase